PAPSHGTPGASPGKSTCPALKPSVLTCRAIQLSGFPIFARLPTLQANPGSLTLCSKAPPRLPPDPTVASGALACWLPSRWLGGRVPLNPSARWPCRAHREKPPVLLGFPLSGLVPKEGVEPSWA